MTELSWHIETLKRELGQISYDDLLQAMCASTKGPQPGDYDEADWWWIGLTRRQLNAFGLYQRAISNYKTAMRGLDPQRAERENERFRLAGKLHPVTEQDRKLFALLGCALKLNEYV